MKKLKARSKDAPPKTERAQRKAAFVQAVAQFLTKNQAKWSILLEMGGEDARLWAAMRQAVPLMGYPTAAEAEQALTEFLA